MLAEHGGLDSGLMMTQYTAASLVSENKTLAHPDVVDLIPTSANQEDFNPMAMGAARHARQIVAHGEQVVALELLAAAQALDLRLRADSSVRLGQGTEKAHADHSARGGVPRTRSIDHGRCAEDGRVGEEWATKD